MLRTISAAVVLLSCASGLVLDSSTWGPSDSVHALDGVITAVNAIVTNPHLSPQHLKRAKQVAEDVKGDIEAVESGKLSKQQTNEKVGAAMKELVAFEAEFTVQKMPSTNEDKLSKLKAELEEKKAALAKELNMMKLLKLKKALAEKKLMLEKLILQKADSKKGGKDVQETGEMVSNLLAKAKNITASAQKNTTELRESLKPISAALQARQHVVSDSLAKLIAEQTKGDADIDAIMKAQTKQEGKDAFDAKKQKMFKHLKTQENRKFAKVRALKQAELKELQEAEKSTEKLDVSSLVNVLTKMQRENRQMQAKSGSFLH